MKCPECGRDNPTDEVMCDCGYIFEEEDRNATEQETDSNGGEEKHGNSHRLM